MARTSRPLASRREFILALAVQYAVAGTALPSRSRLRSWANAALRMDVSVTLRLAGRKEVRALNRNFRGKDHATNVLTFAYPETVPLSGDIVLCVPVITLEAREQGKLTEAHFAHLVVHGMLHLQGYDHTSGAEARVMEALEAEIVRKLGYADPYGSSHSR